MQPGDIVLDIGSNDGTLLKAYSAGTRSASASTRPARSSSSTIPTDIKLVPDFFSAGQLRERFAASRRSIVTSIAMFYDLDDPVDFARQVAAILADGRHLALRAELHAVDAAHELVRHHLPRASRVLFARRREDASSTRAGLQLLDVQMNAVNGGSFAVTAAHNGASRTGRTAP